MSWLADPRGCLPVVAFHDALREIHREDAAARRKAKRRQARKKR